MKSPQEALPKRKGGILTAVAVASSLAGTAAAQERDSANCLRALQYREQVTSQSDRDSARYCVPGTTGQIAIANGRPTIIIRPFNQRKECTDAWNKSFDASMRAREICGRDIILGSN